MSEDAQMREEQKPAETVMHVRMAKASQADLDAAYRIMNLLASMDRGHYPSNEEGSPTFFDSDDWEHLQFLHQQIIEIADNSGGVSRVIGAAGILLNEKNGLIDPDDDCIELHPDLKAMNKAKEEADQLRARIAELETELETAKRRIVHLDGRLSEKNGEVLRLEMAAKHMLKLQEERDAAVIKVDELEADRRRVTVPVRLTDKQIAESHANEIMNCMQDPCDKSESVMPMPHDVNRFVRAIETAVLRANGFKVEG